MMSRNKDKFIVWLRIYESRANALDFRKDINESLGEHIPQGLYYELKNLKAKIKLGNVLALLLGKRKTTYYNDFGLLDDDE
jgi:hypothetical protein